MSVGGVWGSFGLSVPLDGSAVHANPRGACWAVPVAITLKSHPPALPLRLSASGRGPLRVSKIRELFRGSRLFILVVVLRSKPGALDSDLSFCRMQLDFLHRKVKMHHAPTADGIFLVA